MSRDIGQQTNNTAKSRSGIFQIPVWVGVISAVILIAGFLLIARWALGSVFVSDYERGFYRADIPATLTTINFPQPEVGDYDLGAIRFQEGKYSEAEKAFERTVSQELSAPMDCDARVNLALSKCWQMDLAAARSGDAQAKESAVALLHEARDVLTENGCAADDGSSHDAEAQQLKEDIDKLLQELEEKEDSSEKSEEDKQESDSDKQDDNSNQEQKADDDKSGNKKDQQDRQDQQGQGQQEQESDPLKDQLKNQQQEGRQQMEHYQGMQDEWGSFFDRNYDRMFSGQSKPW